MTTPDLPLLPPGARRIPFASASAPQAAQALAYAMAHLAAHFPRLDWPAWSDAFGAVQPDLVVQAPAAWLEGPALARLVQRLAASADHPVPDPPGSGPAAAEPAVPPAYQALARQALAQLAELPGGCSPLLYALVAALAGGPSPAARADTATHGSTDAAHRPDPPVPGSRPASATPGPPAVDAPAAEATALPPPASAPAPPGPAPAPEPGGPTARRTFSDIARDHPRANGKTGFTVRELCRALRISAASLLELHANTGRLSLKALRALAALMQEPVGPVLADLQAGVGPRKERRTR